MTLDDDLIGTWATVYTELPLNAVLPLERNARNGGVAARDAKLDLAQHIVARYHGAHEATRARQDFLDVFSKHTLPGAMPSVAVINANHSVLDLVSAARSDLTRSAVRRLISEGGVRINGERQVDPWSELSVRTGDILQIGKRRWFRVAVHAQ